MSKIVVTSNVTLDGVMQAPARPDEDTRDGFSHGGWARPYADAQMKAMSSGVGKAGALLFGRRTYEDFYRVWPSRPASNPFVGVLNNFQKYVVSRTLTEPLPWQNSTLLKGEAAQTVAKLKQEPGKDIVVLGSGELVRSLLRHNLVDELVLSIHPLLLGSGHRLFDDVGYGTFRLVDSDTTDSGVVIATYAPADSGAGS